MAATGGENGGMPTDVDGLLFAQQGGHGLEGDAHVDVLAIGDAALNAAAMVGKGAFFLLVDDIIKFEFTIFKFITVFFTVKVSFFL